MLLGGTLVPGLASTHEFAFNCTICCTSNCMGIIIKNWNQPMEMKTQCSSMQEGLSNGKKWAAALRVTGICSVLMCILRLIYGKKVCGEMGKCKERGFSCNKNIRWVTIICEHSTWKLFQILEATEVGECYTTLLARLYNVWGEFFTPFAFQLNQQPSFWNTNTNTNTNTMYGESCILPTKTATIMLCSSPSETEFEWQVPVVPVFSVKCPGQ